MSTSQADFVFLQADLENESYPPNLEPPCHKTSFVFFADFLRFHFRILQIMKHILYDMGKLYIVPKNL